MNEAAVRMDGVRKTYPHFVLDDIRLELPRGVIMGFIGPNGAGKSTTLRILMGLIHQDGGVVEVLGRAMPSGQVEVKRDVGFVSEDMRLYARQTLRWHMHFMRSIYPSWDSHLARELLRRFDLIAEQKVKGFSHGQRVKAMLLLALSRRPRLLVLDEPTTGLDPIARQEVLAELMEVLIEEDRSVLFSSHNTRDVEQVSDLVTFIDRGHILESGDKEAMLDRWRRIRIAVPTEVDLPAFAGPHLLERNGRQATLTTGDYSERLKTSIQKAGASVIDMEAMTLEEIFLCRVRLGTERKSS